MTFTADIWTSQNNSSFIALTIHFCTYSFKLLSFTLEVEPFFGSHTGDNICVYLEERFEKWQVKKRNIAIFFRDNGSNIVKACRLLQIKYEGCIGHGMHLVVGTFLSMKDGDGDDGIMLYDLLLLFTFLF